MRFVRGTVVGRVALKMAIEKVEPKYFDLLCGHYEWLAEWESPSNCAHSEDTPHHCEGIRLVSGPTLSSLPSAAIPSIFFETS